MIAMPTSTPEKKTRISVITDGRRAGRPGGAGDQPRRRRGPPRTVTVQAFAAAAYLAAYRETK
jgi:hypothetical protein